MMSGNGKKANRAGRIAVLIYAVLAVCVLTIMSVSLYSISFDTSSFGELSLQIPELSEPGTIELPAQSEVAVIGEQSGVPAGEESEPPVAKVLYVVPVEGSVQKGYAMTSLLFSETMKDFRTHNGVDIASPLGSAVCAYADGTVAAVETDPLMGVSITLTHAEGLQSVYRNLGTTLAEGIAVGHSVKAGDLLGAVGDTAKAESADGPHLHFELLLDGKAIDPVKQFAVFKNQP